MASDRTQGLGRCGGSSFAARCSLAVFPSAFLHQGFKIRGATLGVTKGSPGSKAWETECCRWQSLLSPLTCSWFLLYTEIWIPHGSA